MNKLSRVEHVRVFLWSCEELRGGNKQRFTFYPLAQQANPGYNSKIWLKFFHQ